MMWSAIELLSAIGAGEVVADPLVEALHVEHMAASRQRQLVGVLQPELVLLVRQEWLQANGALDGLALVLVKTLVAIGIDPLTLSLSSSSVCSPRRIW